ncbi:MAG: hypothetical protein ACE5H7_11330 [Acidiferrobacterales bacterium]
MNTVLFEIIGISVLFVGVAILNGAMREKFLAPLIGAQLALPLSGILLSGFVFLITLGMAPFLNLSNPLSLWLVGIFWVFLLLIFEFIFGHYVMEEPRRKLLEQFNPLKGNLFLMVIFATAISPYATAKLRSLI